jgi:DHA1 family tetracycline resistance protein-like MFS transporter
LRPALTAQITHNSRRDEQGLVLGITQSLMSVAQIVAPVIAGYLIDRQLLTAWALVGAAASGLGILIGRFKPAPS